MLKKDNRIYKNGAGKLLVLYLNAAMALAYLFCGLFLFFSSSASLIIGKDFRVFTASILVVYGIFRGYRAYNQYVKNRMFF
jgi:hypothetical protein